MFWLFLILCGISLYIGMRIGWKWGFEAHKRIDDNILKEIQKSKSTEYNRHNYLKIDK